MILTEGAICRLATANDIVPAAHGSDATWSSRKPLQAGLDVSSDRLFRWAAQRDVDTLDTLMHDARQLDDGITLDEREERHLAQAVRYTRCPIALSRLERSHRVRVLGIAARFQRAGTSWPTLVTEARRAFFDAVNSFDFDSSNTLGRWVSVAIQEHLQRVVARGANKGEIVPAKLAATVAYAYGSGAA